MTSIFATRLVEDLVDLKRRTELLESTEPSIASEKLSVGSDYSDQVMIPELQVSDSEGSDSEE